MQKADQNCNPTVVRGATSSRTRLLRPEGLVTVDTRWVPRDPGDAA